MENTLQSNLCPFQLLGCLVIGYMAWVLATSVTVARWSWWWWRWSTCWWWWLKGLAVIAIYLAFVLSPLSYFMKIHNYRFVDGEMFWTYSVITLGFRWAVVDLSSKTMIVVVAIIIRYHHFDLCGVRLLDDHVHHDHYNHHDNHNHHDHDDHLDLFSLFFSGLLGWVGGASESPCLVRFTPLIPIFYPSTIFYPTNVFYSSSNHLLSISYLPSYLLSISSPSLFK